MLIIQEQYKHQTRLKRCPSVNSEKIVRSRQIATGSLDSSFSQVPNSASFTHPYTRLVPVGRILPVRGRVP